MTQGRTDGVRFLLLGIAVFLLMGFVMARINSKNVEDFRGVYLGTRTLLAHENPYDAATMYRVYLAHGGKAPRGQEERDNLLIITEQVYPPTTYLYLAPLGLLGWKTAKVVWTCITALALIAATVLMWELAADYAPLVAGLLAALLIANCEVLFAGGNPAGVVIALCVIAVWCLMRRRFEALGVLCLAMSLTVKPHDTGLVWLFFLLAGGTSRKRALQTLALAAALSVPAVLWVSWVAPHWISGARENLRVLSVQGGLNEPGPQGTTGRGAAGVIDMQAAVATFDARAAVYNTVSAVVCGALLLLWLWKTLRLKPSPLQTWLALATVAPLTLLPIYHRPYDAKLLLLSIPACAMLWTAGRWTRWLAVLFTASALLFTANLPLAVLSLVGRRISAGPGLAGKLILLFTTQPAPIFLTAMAVFYLWVYLRQEHVAVRQVDSAAGV